MGGKYTIPYFQDNIQADKFLECLMYVNNDLGILLQNAENLAYKLGAIEGKDLKYLSYDYYNQYKIKDIYTLRKNIISSMKFLEAQFIAIKQETGKDYIFPPSIELIKEDVKNWKEKVNKISPKDVEYFNKIYSILERGKFSKIKDADNVYQVSLDIKKTEINPYIWMIFSPQILHNIEKNNEIIKNNMERTGQSMPDLIRGISETYKNDLFKARYLYNEIEEINKMLKDLKEKKKKGIKINDDPIKLKIIKFKEKYQRDPLIEEENKEIYDNLSNDYK